MVILQSSPYFLQMGYRSNELEGGYTSQKTRVRLPQATVQPHRTEGEGAYSEDTPPPPTKSHQSPEGQPTHAPYSEGDGKHTRHLTQTCVHIHNNTTCLSKLSHPVANWVREIMRWQRKKAISRGIIELSIYIGLRSPFLGPLAYYREQLFIDIYI